MFKDLLEQNSENWQNIVLISSIALILVITIYLVTIQLLKRFSNRNDNELEKDTHKKFRTPVIVLLISIALSVIISSIEAEFDFFKHLNHFINIVIIFSITWLLIKVIGLGRALVLKSYDSGEKDNLKARKVHTQFKIIERILVAIVIIISISVALMTFEGIRKIGAGLFASAGVAGIILGLSAQKLLGNVLAGFQLALAQPIRLDDVVIVEGEWGRIEEITLTYVVVSIWDKRRLIVPTTYFIEKPFQNWTRESAEILGTVFIYTDYTVPFDKLRKELTRILKADKNWDGKVDVLQVTNATEKTVEIRALMSAVDSSTAWDLRVHVREKLIEYLQKNHPECLPRTRVIIEKEKEKEKS